VRNNKWYETTAIQTAGGVIQGAIQYRIDGRSFVSAEGVVSVEGLATAPWNRPWLVSRPQFRGVGEGLLIRAALHSYLLGFDGRVNLIAFDDARTLEFYQGRGFSLIGHEQGFPLLEIMPDAATAWLQEEGYEI
jgi:hypothetical protein